MTAPSSAAPTTPLPSRGPSGQARAANLAKWSMLAPAGILLVGMFLIPIGYSIFSSTQATGTPLGQTNWVGLQHYVALLTDNSFWHSTRVSLIYTVASVALSYVLGLTLALLVNFKVPFSGVGQGIAIIPWAMPYVAAAMVWALIFDYQYGPLNWALRRLGMIDTNIGWLTDPNIALPVVIVIQVWKLFPLASVMLLSGLQAIPDERLEAAAMDGASARQRLLHVIMPGIRGVSTILTLLLTIWIFGRSFTVVYVLTGGGPVNATSTLVLKTFEVGFQSFEPERASALGTLVLLVAALITVAYWRFGLKKVDA